MIDPEFCRRMARYNAWQNSAQAEAARALAPADVTADRGAFFGSILGTFNHLLWADRLWLHRLAGTPAPEGGIKDSPGLTPTLAAWWAERFRTDGRLVLWAEELRAVDLTGDLTWYSGAAGREITKPVAEIVVHVFNHQTHHRGQIHAMLTAAGVRPGDTDLIFMPEST